MKHLYTRYPIVTRLAALGRVRRASKGILHTNETPFIKSRVNIWNNCIKLIARSETLTTIKISKFKKDLKKTLLKIQNAFNSVEWYPDLNFTLR